jgi:hypothetical protein
MSSRPDLKELPEWVKALGLPKVALDAIDRYWKPVWDEVKHELELLPDDRARPADRPAAAEGDWLAFEAIEELEPRGEVARVLSGDVAPPTAAGTSTRASRPGPTWPPAAPSFASTCPS